MTGKSKIQAVRGMVDIMPPNSRLWADVEARARAIFSSYGYSEIRTPIVEPTELFARGVGETSSVVEKEMYTFVDQGDNTLSLRPEGTASVVRAYLESGAFNTEPICRYFYIGQMFRRERPQKGRQRQFHQIGVELLGPDSPLADAEVIAMTAHFLEAIGVKDVAIEINSIGCKECRPKYNELLLAHLSSHKDSLCGDCTRRLDKNPMRTLDCKQERCAHVVLSAPRMAEHLCDSCRTHFDSVKAALVSAKVDFIVNERIVRGLDYYMRTAFEFTTQKLGSQNAVGGGGRYDGLVEELGGPHVAGVGMALGFERMMMLLEADGVVPPHGGGVFLVMLGEAAQNMALSIIQPLRKMGITVEWDYAAKSMKAQMRHADKAGASRVIIVGDDELAKGEVMVKDLRDGSQVAVKIDKLEAHFSA